MPTDATSPETAPDRADWLRLALTEGLGRLGQLRALRRFGLPGDILSAPYESLCALLGPALARALGETDRQREARVSAALDWLASAPDRHLIALGDDNYPQRWLDLPDPPPCVFVHGNPLALAEPAIAIVGSRHASAAGARTAAQFAAQLGRGGWSITSGLALGIDAAAHAGALDAGVPTVAFIGTGIDRVYPVRNRDLAARMLANGAIVSEFALGTEPLRANFPRRNRLIAAHTQGTLVVEAARRSGSLITAREAVDIGREVFAIPGSIHSPLARGCHALIRQGAKLVETVADILEELPDPGRGGRQRGAGAQRRGAIDTGDTPSGPAAGSISAPAEQVLMTLGWDPGSAEWLCETLGLRPAIISAALLELELAGLIERVADGRFSRRLGPPGKSGFTCTGA